MLSGNCLLLSNGLSKGYQGAGMLAAVPVCCVTIAQWPWAGTEALESGRAVIVSVSTNSSL